MTTAAKIAANKKNAALSTGPKNCTSTRFNAVKHGLLAQGIMELDSPETFPAFCAKITAELQPVGEIENILARRIALDMVRLSRFVTRPANQSASSVSQRSRAGIVVGCRHRRKMDARC